MAFKAKEAKEASSIEFYCGQAVVKVLAINPKLAELKKIFPNYKKEEEPVYTSENPETKAKRVRLTFYCQTDADKCNGIDTIIPVTFFVEASGVKSQAGAWKVIDKYARTAWATEDDIKNKAIPQHSKGAYNISAEYRKAYQGEEELLAFLKAWLNISNIEKWENGKIVGEIENKEEAECCLEDMKALINGNVKELKELLDMVPNNECRIVVGVKTTDKGQTSTVLNDVAAYTKLNNTKLDKINAVIANKIKNGGLKTTDFTGDGNRTPITTLHKYVAVATTFDDPLSSSAPGKGSEDEFDEF